jgi:LemA protein
LSTQQWLALAVGALLVFWMLGAYNRLVALRNAIGAAWAQLDEPVRRRSAAIAALLAALRQPLSDEQAALGTLQHASDALDRGADALRLRPADARQVREMVGAEVQLGAALARLLALLDHHPQLRGQDDVAPHVAALADAAQRLDFARQLFNDAVRGYNDALRQFPTRLLARLFGFGAAAAL